MPIRESTKAARHLNQYLALYALHQRTKPMTDSVPPTVNNSGTTAGTKIGADIAKALETPTGTESLGSVALSDAKTLVLEILPLLFSALETALDSAPPLAMAAGAINAGLGLVQTAVTDLVSGKSLAQTRKDLDDGIVNIVEGLKFPPNA
jgi:hypothetical protein